MRSEDLIALMIPITFLAMIAIEYWRSTGRNWPAIPWWRTQGASFFVMMMSINAVLPSWVPQKIASHHLFEASRLGFAGSVVLGYLSLSLATATLHRAYHRFPVLWRFVHQLHHAPQRLDVWGSVVFTPLEVINNVLISFVVMVFVLGLDPVAAALTGYVAAFYGMFQHFNVRTPVWLGYLIQRPESHSIHHYRGFHAHNYSDLPLWDLLWGTFRNSREFMVDVGFEKAESRQIGAMLCGRDVNAATLGSGNRGRIDVGSNPA